MIWRKKNKTAGRKPFPHPLLVWMILHNLELLCFVAVDEGAFVVLEDKDDDEVSSKRIVNISVTDEEILPFLFPLIKEALKSPHPWLEPIRATNSMMKAWVTLAVSITFVPLKFKTILFLEPKTWNLSPLHSPQCPSVFDACIMQSFKWWELETIKEKSNMVLF